MSLERRTPMKRGGPLKRAPMKRGSSSLKRTRVNPRSGRNVAEGAVRKEIRTASLSGRCTIGPVLDEIGVAGSCAKVIGGKVQYAAVQGLHERRKASSGGSKVNEDNLMPACNACNSLLECEPALVRERGGDRLVVREGDPEWEALGRRHDRFL